MTNNQVNLAIQVLPMNTGSAQESYLLVDGAIALIQQSGLDYEVCPFETVIQGSFDEVMEVVSKIKDFAFRHQLQMLVNMKLQMSGTANIYIEDKMKKYR